MAKKIADAGMTRRSKTKEKVQELGTRSILRGKIGGREMAIVARRGSFRSSNNPHSRVQTPYGGSGDQHADPWSRRIIRELSRDMDRNSDTYRTLMDEWVRVMVGDGVRALFRSSNEEWNQRANRLIHKRMSSIRGGVDSRQMKTGYRLLGDFVRSCGVDGDGAILKLTGAMIQVIESEQITSGTTGMSMGPLNYCDGIKMDAGGAPKKFHICPYSQKTGAIDYGRGKDYDADVVEFVAIGSARSSQTRGLPLLVAGLDDWERIDSYKESEIIAAEQSSMIYGAIEYPEGNMGAGARYANDGSVGGASAPLPGFRGGFKDDGTIDWNPVSAGYIMELPNGVKYVPINPQRPNRDTAPFLIEMLRQFGANAGLPYELVYNDLRGLSWSIHRAMVVVARDKIKHYQTTYFQPIFTNFYVWLTAQLIEEGELEEVDGWDEVELAWPQISWPDEGKEFEAQNLGLRSALTNRHKLFGPEWRKMLDERMIEIIYASELVTQYNKQYPDFKMTPHEFLGLADTKETPAEEGVPASDELKDKQTKTKRADKGDE